MLSKYKIGILLSQKLTFTSWDTQKNNINKKIDEIIITDNSEAEILKTIKEFKKEYKTKYNIFPIYVTMQYTPEIKKYGFIIE